MAGRPKGTPKSGTRRTATPKNAAAGRRPKTAKSALTPLDYMLQVLRDPESTKDEKKWAAQQAAPFVHARLASTKAGGPGGGSVPHDHRLDPAVQEMIDRVIARKAT